jgi:hypothetical protein
LILFLFGWIKNRNSCSSGVLKVLTRDGTTGALTLGGLIKGKAFGALGENIEGIIDSRWE